MAEDLAKLWDQAKPVKASSSKEEDLNKLWEMAAPTHTDPLEGMSAAEKFLAGIGHGMLNMTRSAAGLIPGKVGQSVLDALPGIDKEAAAALKADPAHSLKLNTHLPLIGEVNITPGSVGSFTGELASTAPIGGLAGGGARIALAKLGAKAAAPGLVGLATRAIPALAEGSSQGAILGGPDNRALGALVGGGFAGVGSAAADTLGGLVRGIVRPTAAAREFMSEGVPLSVGQMNPGGALSKIEEAGMHSALGGPSIEAARQLPRDMAQRLAAQEGLAPGAEMPTGKVRPGDFMTELHKAFDPAYAEIDATPIPASVRGVPTSKVVKEAFKRVTEDEGVYAPEGVRGDVSKFLQDQATILDKAPVFNAAGEPLVAPKASASGVKALIPVSELRMTAPVSQWAEAPLSESTANIRSGAASAGGGGAPAAETGAYHTAEPLRVIRSNIRDALRGPGLSDAERKMFSNAEDLMTDAMEKRLGPAGAAKLQAVDRQYAGLRALDRAVNAAGDSELGFTGAQLSRASQQGLGDIAKAQGGGGRLRDLAQLMRETIEAKSPRTGAIKQTLPLGLNHAAGPLGALMNRPTAKAILLGATGPQRAAVTLGGLIRASLPNRAGAGAFLPGPNALLAPMEVQEQ